MPADGELTGPVGYASTWSVVAMALIALVVVYYLGVWLWSRGQDTAGAERVSPVERARTTHLKELDRLEGVVRAGRLPVREGFQQLSATVRSFVAEVSGTPARSMTLEELREAGEARVAETIAAMYPPEFAPGDAAADDFGRSLREARELVRSWT